MSATANGVDPALVTRIVDRVKSQGIFDQFRRDCLADVDTKPAYQNLGARVEGYVSTFLTDFVWTPDMNKNQLRNSLRRQINESEMLASGVERVIEQVVDAQLQQIFLPRIETVVKEYLHSDNTPSSSDVRAAEPPSKPGMESGSIPPQPGSSGSSSSPMVLGVKGSPADSPLPGWSAANTSLQSSTSFPNPPPLPGETPDQPQPPPLPDSSAVQEKPKPPPLPRSREASPPPLPPSTIPERRRHTSSVSSSPSLDSISSDPLSIDSEEEKPKVVVKTSPPKTASPASSTKSTPGKASTGKVSPGKRRVILKKVVVRKADGTKVVRVVRMDPTKATAKKLLMRATSRAAGDQGGSPKGKTISLAKVKTEEGRQQAEEKDSPVKSTKLPEDDISGDVQVSPLLGKRKHLPIDTKYLKVAESQDPQVAQVKDEPMSSGDEEKWTPRPERPKRRGFSREEIAAAHDASDSDEESKPSPVVPKDEDSLSKDLEDISSSGSDMDFEEGTSSNSAPDRRDYFPVDASDSDSHVSDVTVSSVHTSDLSSFDDKISSSSSSSSSSEESEEEEDTDDYGKKPVKLTDQSRADTKPMLLASKDESLERSVSPASSGGEKTSPRLVVEARWKRQHMVDVEDDETRAERRKRADTKVWIDQHHQASGSKAKKAEAKEERAKRRQQMKEEREHQRESATSPSQIETRKQRRGRSEDEGAESKLYTKQQLKEQKLQEKRREAKRQRSLLSQSEDSPAALDSKPRRETEWTPPRILRQEFFLKKRRDSQIPFHHLLTLDMAYKQLLKKSQQRAKFIAMRVREEKEGKKSYSRFAFQAPGKNVRKSRWLQASAERKKWKSETEEPSAPEAVLETVAMDEAEQHEEVQCANDKDRLEMISPTSPDEAPQEPEEDSKGSSRYESIKSPETELDIDQFEKSSTDKADELESERTDNMIESDRLSSEKVDIVLKDKTEAETGSEFGKANDDTANDTTDVKMEENEAPRVSPSQVNIHITDTRECDTSSDKDRNIKGEEMDVATEERVTPEDHHAEEDAKLKEEEEGEQQENDDIDKEQEVGKEEEGQISTKGDEKNTDTPAEDAVPIFVVLEREEISSEEGDFDDPERDITQEQVSSEDKSVKLPSIFQQTEAISSDEELDEIMPSSSGKDKADGDRVEEKSEGEVDEEIPPLAEGESITKLTEDVSGDELSDTHSVENPPTPTMDEPSEFEGIREGSNDGQATIPIVLVSNPGGSGKSLGQSYSTGSSSDAEGTRTRESTPKDDGKIQEKMEDNCKKEEIEEGELAEMEEGEVPEEKEQASGRGSRYRNISGQSDPPEESSGYGKRPRRRTFSPHQGKDDDYLYFGLQKRTRRQSPTPAQSPTPPTQGAVQRKKPLTRERSRSGGMAADQAKDSPGPVKEQEERVPSAPTERRSSRYSRRVSPPNRYSPSEQRAAPKGKGQGSITPPSAPSTSPSPSPHESDQPSQPQQPHRHFTRRMSGRDEERRPHRYEDMYYYDNKRSRGNTNQAPASGKPVRRTSGEERKRKR